MQMYSIMLCGCIHHREDLVKNKFCRLECPDHPYGELVNRMMYCKECGVRRILKPNSGKPSDYCKYHQAIKNKRKKKSASQNSTSPEYVCEKKKYDRLRDIERSDCANRMECLTKYDKYDTVPCKNCDNYKPKAFHEDSYRTKYSFSENTRHGVVVYK